MSSILDALKRLEQEVPDQSVQNLKPSWLDAPSADASLLNRFSGFLLRHGKRLCWVGAIGLFVVGAAIAVKSGALPSFLPKSEVQSPKMAASPDLVETIHPAGHGSLSPEKRMTAPAVRKPEAARTQAAEVAPNRTATPNLHPMPAQRRSSANKARPAAENRDRQPGKEKARIDSAGAIPSARSAKPKQAQAAAAIAASATASASPEADLKKETVGSNRGLSPASLQNSEAVKASPKPSDSGTFAQTLPAQAGLDLQAISWDENPESRIAVINGRVLREGERIEGYLLSEINADDVVFEHTGQIWKLDFRRH